MKVIQVIPAIILASVALWGQTTPAKLEFEVASIRPSGPQAPAELNVGLHIDGAQVRANHFSLKDYLGVAYKLKVYQITGPDWIASERFDISAKLPEGAKREQVPEMLQALLENRFQLKMHRDTKPLPVYGLVVAKGGLKIEALPADPDADDPSKGAIDVSGGGGRGRNVSIDLGKGSSFTLGDNKVYAKKLTMTTFADLLARFEDRPVVDMTELKGNYDLTLEFSPEDFRAMMIRSAIAAGITLPPEAVRLLDGASDAGLQTALQTVGLRLDPRKAPIEMLVVDHAEKAPTEN
jgi:uncharacterized protein (TIGR03435 family)